MAKRFKGNASLVISRSVLLLRVASEKQPQPLWPGALSLLLSFAPAPSAAPGLASQLPPSRPSIGGFVA